MLPLFSYSVRLGRIGKGQFQAVKGERIQRISVKMVSKAFIPLVSSSYRMLIFSYLLCRMSHALIGFQILCGFREHRRDSR
jgi:hypothetical protein